MYRLLIPLLIGLAATVSYAQTPSTTYTPSEIKPNPSTASPEALCNNAGTVTIGPAGVTTQSNDVALPIIFLCYQDSIFIDHNGDADLSGDPNPATPPGLGYIFYKCPPTIVGDNLQTIITDPCMILGSMNQPVIAYGNDPSGDMWFFNNGTLPGLYNMGQPVALHFAPVTFDIFNIAASPDTVGYESVQVGFPPGPCVNVGVASEFEVVYLNPIQESGVNTSFGDDCRGKFQISGGYPEFDLGATYTTIDISLASDPTVKGLIHIAPTQWFNNANIIFSVPQSGTYNVTVEDGKSCGYSFQINMAACDASNSVNIAFPQDNALPGESICVPVTVTNYNDVVGFSFSVQWDPSVLFYTGVQNPNPVLINPIFNNSNLNENLVGQGALGVLYYNQAAAGSTLAAGDTLFEVCFIVTGQLGNCSGIGLTNLPSGVQMENSMGGNYAVTVDTGLICADFDPFTATVEVIDTTCTGTASIKITANGGMTPYEVIWRELPSGPANIEPVIANSGDMLVLPGFDNGTYEFIITDDNGIGAPIADTVTLTLSQLGASLALTQSPTCNGFSNGIVTAVVSVDGVAVPATGYTFAWSGPSIPSPGAAVQNNVPAGAYAVTVTAPNGCTATASGTLTAPSAIAQNSIQIIPASCSGINDGSISLTIQGGTPLPGTEYVFDWAYSPDQGAPTPLTTQTTNPSVISGLAAGNYYVTVSDANGCTFVPLTEYVVNNAREVTVDLVNQQNVLCFGGSSGALTVELNANPAFTNPSYQFFWTPTGYNQVNNTNTSTYSNLDIGTYSVLAVDVTTGCRDTASFTITQPTQLALDTLSITQPSCTFQTDGSITLVATGGTGIGPNFVYTWGGGLPNGSSQNNLGPGTYVPTVTDLNGCIDSIVLTLALPIPPAITSIDSTSVKCGSDGCLTVNTSPVATIFNWTTLAGGTVGSTAQVCDLPGDTYVIVVSDNKGCTTTDTVTLAGVVPLNISDTTLIDPKCNGNQDGSIVVGASDGNPNYTFVWDNGTNGPINPNLGAGPHSVTVTDSKGCTVSGTFTLQDPPAIAAVVSGLMATTCSDSCNGHATLIVNYASTPATNGNFNFLWADGNTDSLRIDLCPGANQVTITDANQCFLIQTVDIAAPPPVDATVSSVPASCNGGDNGSATALGSAGNGGPFMYMWSTGATTSIVNGLEAGNYSVTVKDNKGCASVFPITVGEPSPIVVLPDAANSSNNRCYGDSTGVVAVTASGGNAGGFSYTWADATGNIVANDEQPIVKNLPAGNYSVTVTDALGCTGVNTAILLTNPPPVQGSYEPWEPLICFGDNTILYVDTIFGGSGGEYSFTLDYGAPLPAGIGVNMNGGVHTITYIDGQGCSYDEEITVFEPSEIKVQFTPAVDEIELGETYDMFPTVTPIGLAIDTFLWEPATALLNPGSLSPTAYPFTTTEFILTVYDTSGCTGTGSMLLEVDPNRNVYIPNAFKPSNEEGTSTHFGPWIGNGVEKVNYMQVYNRWGELMYESNNFKPNNQDSEGWDGRYRGDWVEPGVYIYIIEVKFLDNKVLLYRGDVTVVR